ncbi:MAG: DNA mismatch repair protein MutL, partial [Tissierellales bacterium]
FSDSIHNKTVKEETTLNELTFYANNNDFFNNKKDETKELSIDDNNNINKNNFLDEVKIIGVLFSTYVLMEDSKSNKLLIMDQHAAHERIMYEKYKKEYEDENIAIQTLLNPEILELTSTEMDLVMSNLDILNKLGFIVEQFGQNSVIIRGVPILFGKPQFKNFFLEIIDALKANINSSYEIKIDKIMKIACTNAIKSGDKITDIEIKSLIEQLKNTENPYTCPHGRPTIVEISKKDIEKEFRRIM